MAKLKKIFILLLILNLFILCFNFKSFAVNETSEDSENISNNSENVSNTSEDNNDDDNTEAIDSENSTNEVYSTTSNTSSTVDRDSLAESQKINSYSTVSTLPEANLGLNNILNILLIAIGILMILLGIAILIRLKQ